MSRAARKKEQTAVRIIEAAMTLIRRQGYDATTMEQIAAAADIAKGTLYNYFPVKEAILSDWIRRQNQAQNDARRIKLAHMENTRARMIWVFQELLRGVQTQREIFEKYLVYQMQQLVSFNENRAQPSGVGTLSAEIIRLGQESGEIRRDLPQTILETSFTMLFIEVVKAFYLQEDAFNAEKSITQAVDLFLAAPQERDSYAQFTQPLDQHPITPPAPVQNAVTAGCF
jgi:AcrR family transcriptional regulator